MARKIRFPLKMKNGAEVRTLDELKENFDLESVLGYFTDGKLATWLADRYYDEKAEAVSALSADTPNLNAKLCEILEVEYQADNDETDVELIARRREKLHILSAFTDNSDILNNVDFVAMNQDELLSILNKSPKKVYLYGEQFSVPLERKNMTFIGVNQPLILQDICEDFEDDSISFYNVLFLNIEDGILRGCMIVNNNGEVKVFEEIKNIIVPNSVTSIEEYAFEGNKSLTNITIPNSVTSIGNSAFEGCTALESIIIPDSIRSIADYAFEECTALTNVTIPNSVTRIGESAFQGCTALESIAIPNSVTNIGDSVFQGCTALESIAIPNSVTNIGESAFEGCTALESIIIPDSIRSIGDYAFEECTALTNVTIPNSVTSIGDSAFERCSSLTSIVIPESVTRIGISTFEGCSSLTSVTIPNSVTNIDDCAFIGCSALTNVTIPNSVTSIGDYAFDDCAALTNVILPKDCEFNSCFCNTPWGEKTGIGL